MCNLYSLTSNVQAIIDLVGELTNSAGNMAPLTGIFPDYPAPIVRNTERAETSPWRAGACRLHRSSPGRR